ncbi:DUF6520 family protein [Sinomicrobium oceani]|uniref:DUF6520 family protein n=1 Tax=Sinomicrobium oceani TaxID=1150368 RepID=UPI00227D5BBF|nr:DUF6520 family protein [Sinomicrobium oceani]
MKTKRLILSLSVFCMALIGAYAFTLQDDFVYRPNDALPVNCTSVEVACDEMTNNPCQVDIEGATKIVYYQGACTNVVNHSGTEILDPIED